MDELKQKIDKFLRSDEGRAADLDGTTLIKYRGDAKKFVVPGFITAIGRGAFSYRNELVSVIIENGVKKIDDGAFEFCSKLKSVVFPASVTELGDGLFTYCDALQNLTVDGANPVFRSEADCIIRRENDVLLYGRNGGAIPDGVKAIAENAFYTAAAVKNVVIPASVTSIEYDAFNACNGIESIAVADANPVYTSNGNCVIRREDNTLIVGCKNSVIPSSVTAIGESAFSYCEGLTAIVIPDSVTSIGDRAFNGCEKLKRIVIPSSVTSIGYGVFGGCISLESIEVADGNAAYKSRDGFLISVADGLLAAACHTQTAVIPSGVKAIGDCAFNAFDKLRRVVIPNGVTFIGYNSFGFCSELRRVLIPASVATIDESAFGDCDSLAVINYRGSKEQWDAVKKDENWNMFGKAKILYGYTASDDEFLKETAACLEGADDDDDDDAAAENQDGLFGEYPPLKNASGAASLSAPVEIEIMRYYAARGARDVYFSGSVLRRYSGNDKEFVVPDFVTSIGEDAFFDKDGLESVVIPPSVTSICKDAFNGCGIKKIIIPESVTSIGEGAFSGCPNLESITVRPDNPVYRSESDCVIRRADNRLIFGCKAGVIPDSVTSIGEKAFIGCALQNIVIPASVTSIGEAAFGGCSYLESIAVDKQNAVYKSENNCLIRRDDGLLVAGCKASAGEIPDGVTAIGYHAFDSCFDNTSVKLPSSVRRVDSYAFARCPDITIALPHGAVSVGNNAFSECRGLNIALPYSLAQIGVRAFADCGKIQIDFRGSKREWKAVKKAKDWKHRSKVKIRFNY